VNQVLEEIWPDGTRQVGNGPTYILFFPSGDVALWTKGERAERRALRKNYSTEVAVNDGPITIEIGTVTNLAPGLIPIATITGTPTDYILNLDLPASLTGAPGVRPSPSIGTVTTLSPESLPTVTITGTPPDYILNVGVPTPGVTLSIADLSRPNFKGGPPSYSQALGVIVQSVVRTMDDKEGDEVLKKLASIVRGARSIARTEKFGERPRFSSQHVRFRFVVMRLAKRFGRAPIRREIQREMYGEKYSKDHARQITEYCERNGLSWIKREARR
jgi:hypothetical protein